MGRLGPEGRNGLYCREVDVDRFPALAGWRGLNDSRVRDHFGGTLYAFVPDWGPVEEILLNLGLDYQVVFLGIDAAATIRSRLQAGVPTLFYLWSPHSLNAQFVLSRIQLPPYSRALYEQGRSDFPMDVLEKLAAKNLSEISREVSTVYNRFTLETATQESLQLAIDFGGETVVQAVCGWLSTEENVAVWRSWLLDDRVSCLLTRPTVRIEPDSESVPLSTPIRVRLSAYDIHSLPITRADISLVFDGRSIPMQWRRGSSDYIADVPAELTAAPGRYDLVVSANNTWNKTAGPGTSCELLSRTVTIHEPLRTSWILAGAGAAAVVVTGGLFIVVRKRHANLQAIMVLLFTEVPRPYPRLSVLLLGAAR